MKIKAKWSFFNRVGQFIRGVFKKDDREDRTRGWPVFSVRRRDFSAIPPQPPPSIEEKRKDTWPPGSPGSQLSFFSLCA
jgi:hypothetical protein